MNDSVQNAYEDENEKLDDKFAVELELMLKIADLLDRYNYELDAVLVAGEPEIRLIKLDLEDTTPS